jgi:hypothetical protein
MGALWTDLYELKMAVSYLRRAMTGPATFSLFVRSGTRSPGPGAAEVQTPDLGPPPGIVE